MFGGGSGFFWGTLPGFWGALGFQLTFGVSPPHTWGQPRGSGVTLGVPRFTLGGAAPGIQVNFGVQPQAVWGSPGRLVWGFGVLGVPEARGRSPGDPSSLWGAPVHFGGSPGGSGVTLGDPRVLGGTSGLILGVPLCPSPLGGSGVILGGHQHLPPPHRLGVSLLERGSVQGVPQTLNPPRVLCPPQAR